MANARNTEFTIIDYTDEVNLIPKVWDLLSGMDMFEVHNITTTIASVERVQELSKDMEARKRGGERNYIDSEDAESVPFNVPFFPLDRGIKAADIQNFREYGTNAESKTLQSEVVRVMERIRRSHAQLKEKVIAEAIKGFGYGTTANYFTAFNLTQKLANVDFTDVNIDPSTVIEVEARRHIIKTAQDNTGSNAAYDVVAWCGETWFQAFIDHPLVTEAYDKYESQQEPLRKRLGMGGENNSVRVFRHKGVTYVEDLSPNSADDAAFIFPRGVENMFHLYYAPADDASYANTAGQELYLWYKENDFDRQYKVESETSVLGVNSQPNLVVKSTGTFA